MVPPFLTVFITVILKPAGLRKNVRLCHGRLSLWCFVLFEILSNTVSIGCPSEASVGQISGKSITLGNRVFPNNVRAIDLFSS